MYDSPVDSSVAEAAAVGEEHYFADDDEHPLRWLQPTPPQSPQPLVALHVPQAWNVGILDVMSEAMKSAHHDLNSMFYREGSDGSTTVSEDGNIPPSQCGDIVSSGLPQSWMSLATVPQLPPPRPPPLAPAPEVLPSAAA